MFRTDGTKVTTQRQPSWRVELYALWIALKTDPLIVLLFPMFVASNWFYTWRRSFLHLSSLTANAGTSPEFNEYNAAIFNIRARALNNLAYWIAQIIGSVAIGFLLDKKNITRRVRAFSGWTVLLVTVFVVHIWGYFYQRSANSRSCCGRGENNPMPEPIRGQAFPLMPKNWISETQRILRTSGCISFVVYWTRCGRQQHIGSSERCRTILPN
jgi:hypothetical protein